MGVWGGWGCPPHMCTCMHMHAHMHMHTYTHIKHDNFNCKYPMGMGVSTNHKSLNLQIITLHTELNCLD